jgi:hypothetical protein
VSAAAALLLILFLILLLLLLPYIEMLFDVFQLYSLHIEISRDGKHIANSGLDNQGTVFQFLAEA